MVNWSCIDKGKRMSDAGYGKEGKNTGYGILSKEYAKMTLTDYRMCYWYRHFTFLRWNHNKKYSKSTFVLLTPLTW